jgi:hypothetical protein
MRRLIVASAAALLALLLTEARAEARPPSADELPSDVVSAWSDLLYTTIQDAKLFPPPASRAIGYFGVTLHEAVAPGRRNGLSLAGQLNDLRPVPQPDPGGAHDWRIVVNAAAACFMSQQFEACPAALAAVERLRASQLRRLREGVPAAVVARSEAHGQAVANAVFAWSREDGFARINDCAFTPPRGAGLWQPTPLDLTRALQPCWSQLRPFALESAAACAPPPPTPYSKDPDSPFMREAREVKDAVANLTPDQRAIALHWADDRSVTGTPSGHWLALLAQLSRERRLSLSLACEAHARVGIALADAFISCWQAKYEHSYLRPVTAIQETMDPSWLPLLQTPPFPEYTSGHSVASAAAAHAMGIVFGSASFVDDVNADRGLRARAFTSFDEAAKEAAASRLYGGIHFRPAIDNGLAQGECVARAIDAKIRFVTASDR